MPLFPYATEFNKRIPKQKFYENLSITPTLKRLFIDQIKLVYWQNKLAPSTLHIAAGEAVTEIEVFRILLNGKELDESVLRQIDREIPYHILFLLEYGDRIQIWIGYKEARKGGEAFQVNRYYHTDWMTESDLSLRVEGLTMDAVYESFVRQIHDQGAGAVAWSNEIPMDEAIRREEARKRIEREIERLERLARKETQPKKKFELVQKIQTLQRKQED